MPTIEVEIGGTFILDETHQYIKPRIVVSGINVEEDVDEQLKICKKAVTKVVSYEKKMIEQIVEIYKDE